MLEFYVLHRIRPPDVTPDNLSQMFKYVLHFEGIGVASNDEYKKLQRILETNNLTVLQLMTKIAPRCDEMLQRCMWKGTQTRCEAIFQRVNTTEGVCCSFNNHAMAISNFAT